MRALAGRLIDNAAGFVRWGLSLAAVCAFAAEIELILNVSKTTGVERARWMAALSQPYQLTGLELHVSPSIGIARYPMDGQNAEDLLARADEAMYFAKRCGRNTFRFFDSSVMGFSRERLEIEAELRLIRDRRMPKKQLLKFRFPFPLWEGVRG